MTADHAVTTRRRAATRARLLNAAREVIAERGAGGATVEGIAERAGFTRGAFYSNYSDLDELIVDLIRDVGEVRLRDVREAAAQFAVNRTPGLTIGDALSGGVREFVHLLQPSMQEVLLQAELRLYALRHDGAREGYVTAVRETMTGVYEIVASLWRGCTGAKVAHCIVRLHSGQLGLIAKTKGRWSWHQGERDDVLATVPDALMEGAVAAIVGNEISKCVAALGLFF